MGLLFSDVQCVDATYTGYGGGEMYLTVEYTPSRVARWFGVRPGRQTYRGVCTVWYSVPNYRRQSTHVEWKLLQSFGRRRCTIESGRVGATGSPGYDAAHQRLLAGW
jgi:hypothetical protein